MSLEVNVRQQGNLAIADLSGRLTLGDGTGMLRDTVKQMIEQGHKQILLNLGQVSYIDSAGLGELVGCYTTVNGAGGKLKLLNLQKKIKDLLQITKLYTIFEVFEDEAAAAASYQ